MTRILLHLHNALFLKILLFGEDWGGPECAAYIPISTHIKESSAWVVILLAIGFQFNFQRTIRQFYDKTSTFLALRAKIPPLQRVFEIMIASLYFIIFRTVTMRTTPLLRMSTTAPTLIQRNELSMLLPFSPALLPAMHWIFKIACERTRALKHWEKTAGIVMPVSCIGRD